MPTPAIVKGFIKSDLSSLTNDQSFSTVRSGFTKLDVSASSEEYNLTDLTPVVNQLSLGSCVANGTAGAIEILLGIQDPKSVVLLSRLFLYWNSRLAQKTTDQDSGTQPSICFETLKTLGVCPETTWPYAVSEVYSQPPLQAYQQGMDNRINQFYNIDNSNTDQMLLDIETAIRANHPVVFAVPVDVSFTEDFELAESASVFSPPNLSMLAGDHCMIIVGVRTNSNGEKEYKIKNSWGTTWGFGGYCWFSSDYMKLAFDLWVPTFIPNILV